MSYAEMVSKCVTVVNVDNDTSYTFRVEEEGKLPLHTIQNIFGITRVQLSNEPGILLSFDSHGSSNVPFKFGETVSIRGVPVGRPLTAEQLDEKLEKRDEKLDEKLEKRDEKRDEKLEEKLEEKLKPIREGMYGCTKQQGYTLKKCVRVYAEIFRTLLLHVTCLRRSVPKV